MTNRTATTAAIILSLAAAGAPAASAKPADYVPPGDQAPTTVYSRPDKSMIPVATPDGGTVGQPATLQSLTPQARHRVAAISGLSNKRLAAAFGVAPPAANQASASQAMVRVRTPKSGFDWGDAGIGAAGGLALSMIGLGGALALTQRRTRRTRHNPA